MYTKFAIKPRIRVILSNDFGGDPDGIVQLAHHLMSPSISISGIIGSFFTPGTFFGKDPSAEKACEESNELLSVMGLSGKYPVIKGANGAMSDCKTPVQSDGARFIVEEAMKYDPDQPLFVLCGASLTDIASAILLEPSIQQKVTLVWIGGPEYDESIRLHSGCPPLEYNMGIDINAACFIFNNSTISLWQVPRNVYRQVLMSYAELCVRVKTQGKIGRYLAEKIEEVMHMVSDSKSHVGEAYVLGDSPLVLLSVLQSVFDSHTSSSSLIVRDAPRITSQGLYHEQKSGNPGNPENLSDNREIQRKIRVYTSVDARFLLEDFYSKLTLFDLNEHTKS